MADWLGSGHGLAIGEGWDSKKTALLNSSIDSVVARQIELRAGLDTLLKQKNNEGVELGAVLKQMGLIKSTSTDAAIQIPGITTLSALDATLKELNLKPSQMDTILRGSSINSLLMDSIIKKGGIEETLLDSVLFYGDEIYRQLFLDVILKELGITLSTSLDAIIYLSNFGLINFIVKPRTYNFTSKSRIYNFTSKSRIYNFTSKSRIYNFISKPN